MSANHHDASDRKLDQDATREKNEREAKAEEKHASSNTPSHDPAEIRKHDDAGKDRLFEGREQHDDAEKNSEKTRLARDVDKHNHDRDEDAPDSGSSGSAPRKS